LRVIQFYSDFNASACHRPARLGGAPYRHETATASCRENCGLSTHNQALTDAPEHLRG
jgi:hypothetical protein